jgi:hypothetical protein
MTRLWLILTFVACLVLTGIPYWSPAYNVLQLPEGLLGPSALAVLLLAGLCRVFAPARTLAVAGIVCAAMVVVVWVRIEMDTAIDPTTHNLLPFELVLAAIVGLALGAIGAAGGMATEAVLHRARRP